MHYNDLTQHHFSTARQAGVLGPGVRRGAAGARAHGVWVQFDVDVDVDGGAVPCIRDVRFLAFGCPHVIAVADWVAAHATGTRLGPALPDSVLALQQRFAVPVEKLGRLLIVEDAWIAAVSSPYRPLG